MCHVQSFTIVKELSLAEKMFVVWNVETTCPVLWPLEGSSRASQCDDALSPPMPPAPMDRKTTGSCL